MTTPVDEAGFLEFAATLRSPLLAEAIQSAQPLGPIHSSRHTSNRWRRFERLGRWPERFVVVGDGVCAVNPVYAQGMTVAVATAVALNQALVQQRRRRGDGDLTGFARSFQRRVARCSRAAWTTATAEDLRFCSTTGARPGLAMRLLQRYGDAVLAAANGNPGVQEVFLDVVHLRASPAALFRRRVAWPVLTGRHEPPLPSPNRQRHPYQQPGRIGSIRPLSGGQRRTDRLDRRKRQVNPPPARIRETRLWWRFVGAEGEFVGARIGQEAGCGALTTPAPQSAISTPAAKPSIAALERSLAITVLGLAGSGDAMTSFSQGHRDLGRLAPGRAGDAMTSSHQSAATPATCGQAMLVPLMLVNPPPFFADRMLTPGPLIRAWVLEKGATATPCGDCASAATDTTPSAAAGSWTPVSKSGLSSRRLPLPAAPTTTQRVRGSKVRIKCIIASNIRRLAR